MRKMFHSPSLLIWLMFIATGLGIVGALVQAHRPRSAYDATVDESRKVFSEYVAGVNAGTDLSKVPINWPCVEPRLTDDGHLFLCTTVAAKDGVVIYVLHYGRWGIKAPSMHWFNNREVKNRLRYERSFNDEWAPITVFEHGPIEDQENIWKF